MSDNDFMKVYSHTWSTCCGLCGHTSNLMKKCLICKKKLYCGRICSDLDHERHQHECKPARVYISDDEYFVPDFLTNHFFDYLQNFGMSYGTARIFMTMISSCPTRSEDEEVEELTLHPLGKLIGSRLYANKELIHSVLHTCWNDLKHPFFQYGIHVMGRMVQYYDENPDQLVQPTSFKPPTNMDHWFDKEHV